MSVSRLKPDPASCSSYLSSQIINSIASLTVCQTKWTIRARVTNKTDVQDYSNGKLFKMDLCDESGEIRATAFNNECDKFQSMIQINKVYYISQGRVTPADKNFSPLKHYYEIIFNKSTVVQKCTEDSSSIPFVKYDFLPINKIVDMSPGAFVDVIGICTSAGDIQELPAKNSEKLLKKREVLLVDSSGIFVVLTLWNNEAEKFDCSTYPVVTAKGAKLNEFNGSKSLSCIVTTMLRLNPDIPEAHKLRDWYNNKGAAVDMNNIPVRMESSGEWLTFFDVDTRQLGFGNKTEYWTLFGVPTVIFADNVVYKACPSQHWNNKLIDQDNSLFRCEKCNREYPNFTYRLRLEAIVSDPTGDQRVTAFNEAAEALLGRNAEEVDYMLDHDKNAYSEMFEEVMFKSFVFKFRTKMETYRDETRLKTTVMNVQPVDYKDANNRLIKSIKTLSGVEV